jgi:hypothetical protein
MMSLLLQGTNGAEFELGFLRDSSPDSQDGSGDSTWTTASVRVATNNAEWEETSPCLNIFEFTTLADWLDAVGAEPGKNHEAEPGVVELLEPGLRFSVSGQTDGAVAIHIDFQIENRPQEFQVDADADTIDPIDLFVTRPQIRAAATTLRKAIREVQHANEKDDIIGERDGGATGEADPDMNIVDSIEPRPPGAGEGEDNAGER